MKNVWRIKGYKYIDTRENSTMLLWLRVPRVGFENNMQRIQNDFCL